MNLAKVVTDIIKHSYKKCTATRLLLFVLVGVPLYNEYMSFVLQSWLWSSLYLKNSTEDQVKVLFVADPQLQGYNDESATFGFITRWDADRYLKKTFTLAKSFVQPDAIVYLGDLLDEGSVASDSDYEVYFNRFKDIFRVDSKVKELFIPGDNDIGGEGADPRLDWKVNRFHKHFAAQDPDMDTVKFVDFIKMEYNYGRSYDEATQQKMLGIAAKCQNQIRILLNHMALMDRVKVDFQTLVADTKASFVFSAHSHLARLYTCLDCLEKEKKFKWTGGIKDLKDYTVYNFQLNNDVTLNEVTVPTCSYRMGVPRMGYGYALIGKDGEMHYTVLWLPSRYRQLFSYLFLLVTLPIAVLLRFLLLRWFTHRKLTGYASR